MHSAERSYRRRTSVYAGPTTVATLPNEQWCYARPRPASTSHVLVAAVARSAAQAQAGGPEPQEAATLVKPRGQGLTL